MNKKITAVLVLSMLVGASAFAQKTPPAEVEALLKKHICLACHKVDARLVGPAYEEVAKKKYSVEEMVELIYTPKPEHWPGYPAMAAMKQVPKDDATKIAKWINSLAKESKKKKA
jgi:cytochrome c